jgi:hypothetical protein
MPLETIVDVVVESVWFGLGSQYSGDPG